MIDETEYLTVTEAATRKGVPVGTVKAAISLDRLPSVFHETLNRRLVKPGDVDAWVVGRGGARSGAGRPPKKSVGGE